MECSPALFDFDAFQGHEAMTEYCLMMIYTDDWGVFDSLRRFQKRIFLKSNTCRMMTRLNAALILPLFNYF